MIFYNDACISVVAFHLTRGMAINASYGGDFKVRYHTFFFYFLKMHL